MSSTRSEEHTSELQSQSNLVCRLLLEKKKRPSVQVGDPFMEKLLIECCLELYAAGLVTGIQDLGAAGVARATTQLAAGGGSGMTADPHPVPLREPARGPAATLGSGSPERQR